MRVDDCPAWLAPVPVREEPEDVNHDIDRHERELHKRRLKRLELCGPLPADDPYEDRED